MNPGVPMGPLKGNHQWDALQVSFPHSLPVAPARNHPAEHMDPTLEVGLRAAVHRNRTGTDPEGRHRTDHPGAHPPFAAVLGGSFTANAKLEEPG